MQEPTLVILAAGMGSRFGGLKQITAMDDRGHAIIDYSLYDAYRVGFRKLIFIIKHEIEEDFKAAIGRRMEKYFDVKYVYQQLDILPEGFSVPEGRVKPWGTSHAVLCCKDVLDGPFAVINADDFYGMGAYRSLYDFLSAERAENEHAMISYRLRNTVTMNGSVARGICQVEDDMVTDVVERTKIVQNESGISFTEDGETYQPLDPNSLVSMNCWGFSNSILGEIESHFIPWLEENLKINPEKCEYYLPYLANLIIKEGRGTVRAIPCEDEWHGVTYREDMPSVVEALAELRRRGVYPAELLE